MDLLHLVDLVWDRLHSNPLLRSRDLLACTAEDEGSKVTKGARGILRTDRATRPLCFEDDCALVSSRDTASHARANVHRAVYLLRNPAWHALPLLRSLSTRLRQSRILSPRDRIVILGTPDWHGRCNYHKSFLGQTLPTVAK